jgi:hypothetical protein
MSRTGFLGSLSGKKIAPKENVVHHTIRKFAQNHKYTTDSTNPKKKALRVCPVIALYNLFFLCHSCKYKGV